MADLQGRKVFKVFNQDFIVDERYNVTKELGQGAYGIVWYVFAVWRWGCRYCSLVESTTALHALTMACTQMRQRSLAARYW